MTTTRFRLVLVFLAGLVAGGVVSIGALQAQAPALQAPKEPATVVLPAVPVGNVTLTHQAHAKTYDAKCADCHHASKTQKALKTPHQKCGDCHTKAAVAPMTTKLQAAFHDPMGKKGTCIDCHQQAIAKGNKKAPAKCADCHKKA